MRARIVVIEYQWPLAQFPRMKNHIKKTLAAATVLFFAHSASAACYADYKAKRDDPLRLHYGVIELPDAVCNDPDMAAKEAARRISAGNWRLLNVLAIFGEDGLDKRKESAGKFFLRF